MNKLGRIEDYNKVLPIVELYTAVQSEGSRAGYPTIIIRTTGCTHRCFFGEGGWCDSWYTSIHPEKGTFTFNDIIKMYDDNPHISEMMLTGGAPTMHPAFPINLVSISPKFANSIPVLGAVTPQGKVTDQKMIDQHNKLRLNYASIARMISYHDSYHLKPVIDKNLDIIPEYEEFLDTLAVELQSIRDVQDAFFYTVSDVDDIRDMLKFNTWMMPAGDDRPALFESYPVVMNYCRDNGYKFTGREHIMAFGTERCV